jgi:hypothetical protein
MNSVRRQRLKTETGTAKWEKENQAGIKQEIKESMQVFKQCGCFPFITGSPWPNLQIGVFWPAPRRLRGGAADSTGQ